METTNGPFQGIWVEKYRPRTLADMVLSDENRKFFNSVTTETPNLLFVGSPGIGKTTIAKIIVHDILKCQYLYINASDENGIDTIRTKVSNFSQIKSLDGNIKIVILDECVDEDTIITVLRDGVACQIAIKDANETSDLVRSCSLVDGNIEYRPFYLIDKGIQDVYEVTFANNQKIVCTGSHKWYVSDPSTNAPIKMTLDDIISNNINYVLSKNQNYLKGNTDLFKLTITNITALADQRHVYDLSVEVNHNFFVGESQVLTSNCDGITIDAQRALRNTMEEYSGYTRFILTANYKHKIIPAIQSRTQHFDLTPTTPAVLNRVLHVLKQEKVTLPATENSKLVKIVKDCYPDIRRTLNAVQKFCIDGVFTAKEITNCNQIVDKIHDLIRARKVIEVRKLLIANESEFQGDYGSLLKQYLNFLYNKDIDGDAKRQSIIIISEYLYRDVFCTDKEINAFACFCQLEKIIS
jgi:DNA polymerase III delta prime subunit